MASRKPRESGNVALGLGEQDVDLEVKVERRGTVCLLSVNDETIEVTFTNDGSVDVSGSSGSQSAQVKTRKRKPGK